MAKYILRRLVFMVLTMLLVSLAVFLISEAAPGDVARHILGQFAAEEQVELMRDQMGLDEPLWIRYVDWLIGNDWRITRLIGMPLAQAQVGSGSEMGWYAVGPDGILLQWRMKSEGLVEIRRMPDGSREEVPFEDWRIDENGDAYFWGVDTANHAVLWYPRSRAAQCERGIRRQVYGRGKRLAISPDQKRAFARRSRRLPSNRPAGLSDPGSSHAQLVHAGSNCLCDHHAHCAVVGHRGWSQRRRPY